MTLLLNLSGRVSDPPSPPGLVELGTPLPRTSRSLPAAGKDLSFFLRALRLSYVPSVLKLLPYTDATRRAQTTGRPTQSPLKFNP